MGKAPLKSKLKDPTLAQETWITLHATWFLSHGTQMEKFLSKEVLRYRHLSGLLPLWLKKDKKIERVLQ